MSTHTIGTPATTSLVGVQFNHAPATLSDADLATIAQGIYKDVPFAGGNRPGAILPGAFSRQGLLWLPSDTRSSPLVVRTGDWVAVDSYGDVFLIPRRALPTTLTGSVTLASGSSVVASATDITSYGWQVGTHVASSHTPAGSVIGSIAPGGLSFTLLDLATGALATATGSATETMTAGTFTHS